jgi:hypothetical protein
LEQHTKTDLYLVYSRWHKAKSHIWLIRTTQWLG